MSTDTAAIRQFLADKFNDEELNALSFDNFPDVYRNFSVGMSKGKKIQLLLDYCQRRDQLPALLATLKDTRPEQYEAQLSKVQLSEPESVPTTESALLLVSRPEELEKVRGNRITWEKDGKEMVRVPEGKFLYGEEKEAKYLFDFWIDRTPVTNAEYARFVAATDHPSPAHWKGKAKSKRKIADHPVVYVSKYDAFAYAEWAGKDLPTEEEWEKAARGPYGREFPWGDQEPTKELCNFDGNEGATTPVGRYSPQGDSPYGCVDMSGNVWEQTAADSQRPLHGGAWSESGDAARASKRSNDRRYANEIGSMPPIWDRPSPYIGFRLVVRRPPSQ